MNNSGLRKLYWGFLFIMLSFRIQGVDIFPDIVGYLLFAFAFSELTNESQYFNKASKYNIPMLILSIFSIYESPNKKGIINFGILGAYGIPISIASAILSLIIIYFIFMGIKDMSEKRNQLDLAQESTQIWNYYIAFEIAVLAAFLLIFVPFIAVLYIVVMVIIAIILLVKILSFIKACDIRFSSL